jgi:hypothetical protein
MTITETDMAHDLPFTVQIDQMFLDTYCILNKPLTNIKLVVLDSITGETLAVFNNIEGSFYQLIKKQTFYKYFQENPDSTALIPNQDIQAYLNNAVGNAMSTLTDLNDSLTENTDKYLLRLPFIDKEFYLEKTPQEMFNIMDTYFIANYTEELINYNTLISQAFHNTIDLPPKYYDSLFYRNTMPTLTSPKIQIDLTIMGDTDEFISSQYDDQTDFEIIVRIEIINFLKKKEGFLVEFFETDLENHLYNNFSPIIKNVSVRSPTLFQVNNSADIYYDIQTRLDFIDLLNFIPPYFYYDYNNLNLEIIW